MASENSKYFFSAVESLNLALFNDVSKSSKRSFFNYVDKILAHYWPSTLLSLVEICHGIPFLLKFIFFKKATKIDEIFTVDLTLTKCQWISKAHLGILEFFQKIKYCLAKKIKFVCWFLGRIIGLRETLRLCLTFT